MDWENRIPRFTFYLHRTCGQSLFWFDKSKLRSLTSNFNKPVEINLKDTPLKGITLNEDLLCSIYSQESQVIEIYRYDANDQPDVFNKDTYKVYENLSDHFDIDEMVTKSSTCENFNFNQFIQNHILLVKQKPGANHWSTELPDYARVIISST